MKKHFNVLDIFILYSLVILSYFVISFINYNYVIKLDWILYLLLITFTTLNLIFIKYLSKKFKIILFLTAITLTIFLIYDFSIYTFIAYLIISLVLILYQNKKYNYAIFTLDNIFKFFCLFTILILSEKIVYWDTFENFVFYKITSASKHINYKFLLDFIIPLINLIILFSISLLVSKFNRSEKINIKQTKNFIIIIIPLIIFFIESFNTSRFFLNDMTYSLHHWQAYIGPIEMMKQGGYLLWDVPSQYGFLSSLTIFLMPFKDPWLNFYFLNSTLTFIFSIMLFITIWNRQGFFWYIISFLLTFSLVFILTGGQWQFNQASTPSSGMMRFFWAILLMFAVVKIYNFSFYNQLKIVLPIWLIGVFWSFESAFYVSCIILPWVLYFSFFSNINFLKKIICFFVFPISFFIILICISLFYVLTLGTLPDYFSFVEYAFSWTFNSLEMRNSTPELFKKNGSIILIIFAFSFYYIFYNRFKYLTLVNILFVWSCFYIIVGKGTEFHINNFLNIIFISFFLLINLLDAQNYQKAIFIMSPIIAMVITASFGNPAIIKHISNTLSNQDYFFKSIEFNESEDFNNILTLINPDDIPIAYVKEGRYWNYNVKNSYFNFNNNKIQRISHNIWLPIYPASLFGPLHDTRKKEYIHRWLDTHPTDKGWLILGYNDIWHSDIELILNNSLKEYNILETIVSGKLKGILFKKK